MSWSSLGRTGDDIQTLGNSDYALSSQLCKALASTPHLISTATEAVASALHQYLKGSTEDSARNHLRKVPLIVKE